MCVPIEGMCQYEREGMSGCLGIERVCYIERVCQYEGMCQYEREYVVKYVGCIHLQSSTQRINLRIVQNPQTLSGRRLITYRTHQWASLPRLDWRRLTLPLPCLSPHHLIITMSFQFRVFGVSYRVAGKAVCRGYYVGCR